MNTEKRLGLNTSIEINVPIEQVWQVLVDFDTVSEWAPGVTESYGIGKERMGVGHGRHCEIKGFGGLDEYITDYEAGRGYTYEVTPLGPLHEFTSQWSINEIGVGKTRLSIAVSYELRFSFVGKLMHKLIVRNKLESSLPEVAEAVKNRAEFLLDTKMAA